MYDAQFIIMTVIVKSLIKVRVFQRKLKLIADAAAHPYGTIENGEFEAYAKRIVNEVGHNLVTCVSITSKPCYEEKRSCSDTNVTGVTESARRRAALLALSSLAHTFGEFCLL